MRDPTPEPSWALWRRLLGGGLEGWSSSSSSLREKVMALGVEASYVDIRCISDSGGSFEGCDPWDFESRARVPASGSSS